MALLGRNSSLLSSDLVSAREGANLEVRGQPIVFLKEELRRNSSDGQQRAPDGTQCYSPLHSHPHFPVLSPKTEVVGHFHSMAGSHQVMPLSYVSVDSYVRLEVSSFFPPIFQELSGHFPTSCDT